MAIALLTTLYGRLIDRRNVSPELGPQPRVANDTAEHRALNRRVDITFVAGKDKHGGWSDASDAGPQADR